MLARVLSRLITTAAIAILAGVTFYFLREYRLLGIREEVVAEVQQLADTDGPCAGLFETRRRLKDAGPELAYVLNDVRQSYASAIVGKGDKRGQRALLAAERDGLVDGELCEHIRLAQNVGEVHPVLALLRYTKEGGDVCEDEAGLNRVLGGLGSHRAVMLHALLENVSELRCLAPSTLARIAEMVAGTAYVSPRAFDDLDTLRIAGFLDEWAPLAVAQLGCKVEARSEVSRLGSVVGCTPDHKRRLLSHYATLRPLSEDKALPPLPEGSDVVLLRQSGPAGTALCDVMPAEGEAALYTTACSDLVLTSDLDVAVRIDSLTYGLVSTDLVAGLTRYVGKSRALVPVGKEPSLRSWYGYSKRGEPLGAATLVDLERLGALLGQDVPEKPLRTHCDATGARYCYDVDWAHAISRLEGEAVVFLSRPSRVFLAERLLPMAQRDVLFNEAFGRAPSEHALQYFYKLSDAPGADMVVEAERERISVRWRVSQDAAWQSQVLGRASQDAVEPSVRLLAALDLEQDATPELVIQQVTHEPVTGGVRDTSDEIVLLRLDAPSLAFVPLNRLTVREY